MDQATTIWSIAEKSVQNWGNSAYERALAQAEIAKLNGDRESAITWWDIALAVVEVRAEARS